MIGMMVSMKLRWLLTGVCLAGLASAALAQRTIRLSPTNDFQNVSLNVGDRLVLTLRSHSGTDYKWVLGLSDDSMLRFDQAEAVPTGQGMPGGWAYQQFQFTAVKAGNTYATFNLMSQSSVSDPAAKTFRVNVSISVPKPPPSGTVVLDESNNGNQSVKFYQGQTVEVRLKSNPSTGYNWSPNQVPTGLLQQIGDREYIRGNSGLMGAGGTTVFRYKVVASGGGILSYNYCSATGNIGKQWQVIFSIPRP